jgi:Flp pilus assembly pilin Flp
LYFLEIGISRELMAHSASIICEGLNISMLNLAVRAHIGYANLKARVSALASDPRGVTALEYSLIAGVTVVAIGTALVAGGILTSINTIWTAVKTDLAAVATPA